MLNYNDFKFFNFPSTDRLNRFILISSKKATLPGHRRRLDFIDKLLSSPIGNFIDVYGFGFNDFDDKFALLS